MVAEDMLTRNLDHMVSDMFSESCFIAYGGCGVGTDGADMRARRDLAMLLKRGN